MDFPLTRPNACLASRRAELSALRGRGLAPSFDLSRLARARQRNSASIGRDRTREQAGEYVAASSFSTASSCAESFPRSTAFVRPTADDVRRSYARYCADLGLPASGEGAPMPQLRLGPFDASNRRRHPALPPTAEGSGGRRRPIPVRRWPMSQAVASSGGRPASRGNVENGDVDRAVVIESGTEQRKLADQECRTGSNKSSKSIKKTPRSPEVLKSLRILKSSKSSSHLSLAARGALTASSSGGAVAGTDVCSFSASPISAPHASPNIRTMGVPDPNDDESTTDLSSGLESDGDTAAGLSAAERKLAGFIGAETEAKQELREFSSSSSPPNPRCCRSDHYEDEGKGREEGDGGKEHDDDNARTIESEGTRRYMARGGSPRGAHEAEDTAWKMKEMISWVKTDGNRTLKRQSSEEEEEGTGKWEQSKVWPGNGKTMEEEEGSEGKGKDSREGMKKKQEKKKDWMKVSPEEFAEVKDFTSTACDGSRRNLTGADASDSSPAPGQDQEVRSPDSVCSGQSTVSKTGSERSLGVQQSPQSGSSRAPEEVRLKPPQGASHREGSAPEESPIKTTSSSAEERRRRRRQAARKRNAMGAATSAAAGAAVGTVIGLFIVVGVPSLRPSTTSLSLFLSSSLSRGMLTLEIGRGSGGGGAEDVLGNLAAGPHARWVGARRKRNMIGGDGKGPSTERGGGPDGRSGATVDPRSEFRDRAMGGAYNAQAPPHESLEYETNWGRVPLLGMGVGDGY